MHVTLITAKLIPLETVMSCVLLYIDDYMHFKTL